MVSDQDMNDIMDRLTERDDDIVFGPLDPEEMAIRITANRRLYQRDWLATQKSKDIHDILRLGSFGVLMPFTDADGKRWTPD